jgi:hypothetical protein
VHPAISSVRSGRFALCLTSKAPQSLQSLIGTGLLGGLLASGVPLICQFSDGRCYELPLSKIGFRVPVERMQQLLQQHGKVGDADDAVP